MGVGIEEFANMGQIGHEQEMDEIDVERPATDVLQRHTHQREFREELLIVTEIHKGDGQQTES